MRGAPRRAEEIIAYWQRLRGERPCPALAEIDRALIGGGWRDSMIIAFEDETMPRISRLGEADGAIEYTPQVTDWVLTRGRQAVRRGTLLDEIQRFFMSGESPRYRLLALPLATRDGAMACVLCHLSPAN